MQVYTGMISAARGIVAQHGSRGLYNGLGITMLEIVPYAALQFGLYDSFNAAYNVARVWDCTLTTLILVCGTIVCGTIVCGIQHVEAIEKLH